MTGPVTGSTVRSASRRLLGVDAARGLALIGMMSVHVLPGPSDGSDAPGAVTEFVYGLAEGRAAALFAVVAGVSLVLSRATRAQIAVRALVVAALGLSLGVIPSPIAIILTVYGLLFLLALPFLRLSAPVLAVLAALWALLSPLASQWLRTHGLDGWPENPAWSGLADPGAFAKNLLLTGYYPALTWLTYLLAGLAAGRFLLGRDAPAAARTGRWIALAGLLTAVTGWVCSVIVVRAAGGISGLTALLEPWSLLTGRGDRLLDATFYGTTPRASWWWVGVDGPHSGSIADLLQTTGSALVLLGVALVLAPWAAMRIAPRFTPPFQALVAAGAMTLTIYTLHVVIMDVVASLPVDQRPPEWPLLLAQVVLALAGAWAWGAPRQRGPLEELVAVAVSAATSRTSRTSPSARRQPMRSNQADRDDARAAVWRQALSVSVATGAYGISFGAVGVASGLSIAQTCALSLLMFSGGSQFALAGVVGAGGGGLAAVLTPAFVGIRNAFYGLQMAPVLAARGWRRLAAIEITIDESTAVGSAQLTTHPGRPELARLGFWATGIGVYVLWNLSTLLGAVVGSALGDPARYGFDAAAAAAFLALLWPRLRDASIIQVAAAAAVVATVALPFTPAGLPVLLAAAATAVIALVQTRRGRDSVPDPGGVPAPVPGEGS